MEGQCQRRHKISKGSGIWRKKERIGWRGMEMLLFRIIGTAKLDSFMSSRQETFDDGIYQQDKDYLYKSSMVAIPSTRSTLKIPRGNDVKMADSNLKSQDRVPIVGKEEIQWWGRLGNSLDPMCF